MMQNALGADRAKYGEGLLKKLAERLNDDKFRLSSLKSYRQFLRAYLVSRFGWGCILSKQIGQTLSGFLTEGQIIETAEYLAPFTDRRLFLSEYQLQLSAKEKFTEFLKKENEGLYAKGKLHDSLGKVENNAAIN